MESVNQTARPSYVRKLKGNDDKTLNAFKKIRHAPSAVPLQRQPAAAEEAGLHLENMSMEQLVQEIGRIQAEMARKAQDQMAQQ